MKKLLTLTMVVFQICFLTSQTLVYNLDPAAMSILDQTSGDTLMTVDDNIQSHKAFRVQRDDTSGYVNIRAILNPEINLRDDDENLNVELLSSFNGSGAIKVYHRDANGVEISKIELISNFSQTDDARIITDELEIRGGSDLAELFEITGVENEVAPGSLLALDSGAPGKLRLTQQPYDRNIAGVISGANGVKPGILMGQQGTEAYGQELVTISGRTYVQCNTSNGEIKVGDLLTSSAIQGQAMKATHRRKSRGTIIGKAMSNLNEDEGYVLVLVNLQ